MMTPMRTIIELPAGQLDAVSMAAYVHCSGCHRAFDAASAARCPACGKRVGQGVGTAEQRVADAAEEIRAALASASPAERDALARVLDARLGPVLELALSPAPPVAELAEDRMRARWTALAAAVVGAVVRTVQARRLPTIPARREVAGFARRVLAAFA